MAESRRLLRIVTSVVWSASIATVALSLYTAHMTGYHYGSLVSFRTYNGILIGSAFILAMVLLAGILTIHRIDAASQRLVKSMGEAVHTSSGLPLSVSELQTAVNEKVERTPNSAKAQGLQQALEEYRSLQTLRRDMRSLMAAPVGLLSAIFAVSAWALPATEGFLQSFGLLNTTLVFFVSYGMVVAVVSAIAAALLMLSARRATVS